MQPRQPDDGSIVVGIGERPHAAVEWGAREAQRGTGRLRLVQVLDTGPVCVSAWGSAPLCGDDLGEAAAVMEALVATVAEAHPLLSVSGLVRHGDAYSVLRAESRCAHVTVLGASPKRRRGWGALSLRTALGRSGVPVVSVSACEPPGAPDPTCPERLSVLARSPRRLKECLSWACGRSSRGRVVIDARLALEPRHYADRSHRAAAEEWLFDLLAVHRPYLGDAGRLSGLVACGLVAGRDLERRDLVVVSARGGLAGRIGRSSGWTPGCAVVLVPSG